MYYSSNNLEVFDYDDADETLLIRFNLSDVHEMELKLKGPS